MRTRFLETENAITIVRRACNSTYTREYCIIEYKRRTAVIMRRAMSDRRRVEIIIFPEEIDLVACKYRVIELFCFIY